MRTHPHCARNIRLPFFPELCTEARTRLAPFGRRLRQANYRCAARTREAGALAIGASRLVAKQNTIAKLANTKLRHHVQKCGKSLHARNSRLPAPSFKTGGVTPGPVLQQAVQANTSPGGVSLTIPAYREDHLSLLVLLDALLVHHADVVEVAEVLVVVEAVPHNELVRHLEPDEVALEPAALGGPLLEQRGDLHRLRRKLLEVLAELDEGVPRVDDVTVNCKCVCIDN